MHDRPHSEATKAKIAAAKRGKPATWKHRPSRMVEGETRYRCGHCLAFKPSGEFHKSNRTSLGIKSDCKVCHSAAAIRTRDPERVRASGRRSEAVRRARKAGAGGTVTVADRQALAEILGLACLRCGSADEPTEDHIVPLAKRGAHHPTNLQPLCRTCNERKQARFADYRSPDQIAAVEALWAVTFERTGLDKP